MSHEASTGTHNNSSVSYPTTSPQSYQNLVSVYIDPKGGKVIAIAKAACSVNSSLTQSRSLLIRLVAPSGAVLDSASMSVSPVISGSETGNASGAVTLIGVSAEAGTYYLQGASPALLTSSASTSEHKVILIGAVK